MTPFTCSALLLGLCVVALLVERGVRLYRRLRRIAEASAWGWEL